MKKVACDICGFTFLEGIKIPVIEYENRKGLFGGWKLSPKLKKISICKKCYNTGSALIRNNLAIKTSDILRR